jgi:ribosomal protein S18 acetylase RimI-like enzyme
MDAKKCMDDVITIPSPHGRLALRPERADDEAFRYRLFCRSRPPEWDMVQIDPQFREQLMQHQFMAQTTSYRAQFPKARFDIIELDDQPIGRIVVDRPGSMLNIVDQAIVPELRNKGLGTTIMRSLMDEARAQAIPVRLMVGSSNDPSLRLYLRLGFVPIETIPLYIELEWKAPADSVGA